MMKIVTAPNSVLSQQAKKIAKVDKEILNLIEEMKKTLDGTKDPEGVGLAAPQVGKSLQLFITKPTPKSPFKIFINPVIEMANTEINADNHGIDNQHKSVSRSGKSKESSKKLEGCLSLPSIWGEVKRESSLWLSFIDEKGKIHKTEFKGFMATIIQHEYDHLQGVLFPKRVLEQKGKLYKSSKNEKNEDVFEEIEV